MFTANEIPFPERIIQAASLPILLRIVRSSNAITLASAQVVRDEMSQGKLDYIEVSESIAPRSFGLHMSSTSGLSQLGQLFCDLAAEMSPDGFVHSQATLANS